MHPPVGHSNTVVIAIVIVLAAEVLSRQCGNASPAISWDEKETLLFSLFGSGDNVAGYCRFLIVEVVNRRLVCSDTMACYGNDN